MRTAARILLALAACSAAAARATPEAPIVLVNSYPAGGPAELAGSAATNKMLKILHGFAAPSITDVLAERAGAAVSGAFEQAVRVQRRAQGRSIVGTRQVADAPPDGRTLLFTSSVRLVTHPRLYRLPYVPLRDLVPVAALARMPVVVVAGPRGPATLGDFLAAARAAPGALNYGSAGDFRTSHLAGELLRRRAAIEIVHVSYNGGNEALNGLLTGQVEVAFVPLPSVLPVLGSGRFRVLAIADPKRLETLPDVPAVSELGLGEFEAAKWFGLFAPAGTPAHVVEALNAAIVEAFTRTSSARLLQAYGLQAQHLTAAEFEERLRAEQRKWDPLIRSLKSRSGETVAGRWERR
jgi:tripartite-type tricarboxylate transporter receptor subunit TctC